MTRNLLTWAARVLPPDAFARLHALAKLGYVPRLNDPRTFTERLLAKRARDHDPLIALTADKYTLREYVEQHVGSGYLASLYAVVEAADEIDVSKLPRAYVMKGTHGSGWNKIVTNGDLSNEEARSLAGRWLSSSFYWKRQEWAYRELKPRVIFEENLAPGEAIDDYKMFTFGGVPALVQVDRDRFTHHKRALYTPEWRLVDVACDYPRLAEPVPPPEHLDEMLAIAGALGKPFGFARVDLYSLSERVVVGEITHYPDSGVVRFTPSAFDAELGAVWGEARPVSETFLVP